MSEERENQTFIPVNELHLASRTLDPVWGKEATHELFNSLKNLTSFVAVINTQGKVLTDENNENMIFLINTKGQLVNKKGELILNDQDKPVEVDAKESAWGLLSYYNKDLRLGYLKTNAGLTGMDEVEYCQHYLDIAGDCLRLGYPKSFTTALTRAITRLELSQSRDGNLRKDMITINQNIKQDINKPKPKKGLLGGKD